MNITFVNLRGSVSKGEDLSRTIAGLREGHASGLVRVVEGELFALIDGSPFAYNAPRPMLLLSSEKKVLSAQGVIACQGIGASARFHRLVWEVPPSAVQGTWLHMAHGTPPAPFYKPTTHVFLWAENGREAKADVVQRYPYLGGNHGFKIQAEDQYCRPGLCYGKRTDEFTVQVMPSGHVFSFEGTAVFPGESAFDVWSLLSLLNSSCVALWLNEVCAEHKAYNYVMALPMPDCDAAAERLSTLAQKGWLLQRDRDTYNITSPVFVIPRILAFGPLSLDDTVIRVEESTQDARRRFNEIRSEINDICCDLYAVQGEFTRGASDPGSSSEHADAEDVDRDRSVLEGESRDRLVRELIDYAVGAGFGRWDIRIATGEMPFPALPSAFDPLPVVPPGALSGGRDVRCVAHGSHAECTWDVSWTGILIDSPGDRYDIERCVRGVISRVWSDRAASVEQQACEALGCTTLSEYIRGHGAFFADHLKRHSRGRRYAPVYWPLSSPAGSYTLWLYYQRLTDQTLYMCVNDFVEPKLKQVADGAARLRSKARRSLAEDKELERLCDLELEFMDFRDELLRIAKFWKPNLNDGVQITAAPLWKLFQHRQWQKRLKDTWAKLEAGEYDWAHLAMSIWPDRVVRASHKDRSYAIAHDLEDRLWHEVEVESKTRGGKVRRKREWQPRELSDYEVGRIATGVKSD